MSSCRDSSTVIIEPVDGRLPLEVIFDRGSASPGVDRLVVPGPGAEQLFRSHVLDVGPSIERAALDTALDELGSEVVRVKGLVALAGEASPLHTVQIVGRRREITPAGSAVPATHVGQLVVISVDGRAAPR